MLWRTNWTLKNGRTSLSVLLPGMAPGLSGTAAFTPVCDKRTLTNLNSTKKKKSPYVSFSWLKVRNWKKHPCRGCFEVMADAFSRYISVWPPQRQTEAQSQRSGRTPERLTPHRLCSRGHLLLRDALRLRGHPGSQILWGPHRWDHNDSGFNHHFTRAYT